MAAAHSRWPLRSPRPLRSPCWVQSRGPARAADQDRAVARQAPGRTAGGGPRAGERSSICVCSRPGTGTTARAPPRVLGRQSLVGAPAPGATEVGDRC